MFIQGATSIPDSRVGTYEESSIITFVEIIGPKYINEPTSCSLFNLKLHNCNYVNEDIFYSHFDFFYHNKYVLILLHK